MVKMKTTSAIKFYRWALDGLLTICTHRISPRHKGFTRRGALPEWISGSIPPSCEKFFVV